jgi:AcrR family transcriptional regulator
MSCKPACATCKGLRGNALEIVGEDGADGVTLERLSAASGLPVAEISTHYPTGAECVYETYDEVGCEIVLDLIDAFAEGTDWQSALELSNRRLLERLAASPAQARLCFVETVSGDRELRRRMDVHHRQAAQFLARERERRAEPERLPETQFELLIGASFQVISTRVASGEPWEVDELEPKLAEITGLFVPARV